MCEWLRKLFSSGQPDTTKQNKKTTQENGRIKRAGYTVNSQSYSRVHIISNIPEEKKPVLVRGDFWKNTEETRWDLQRGDQAESDSSIEGLIIQLSQIDKTEGRHAAVERLSKMGQAAVPAIPALVKVTIDVDASVRDAALNALESIDPCWEENPETQKAIHHLVAAINSWSPKSSKIALGLLHRIGKPAIPELVQTLSGEKDTVDKVFIIRLLAQIGPNAEESIPGLIKALSSQFLQVRIAAADALANEGKAAKAAIPDLVAGLRDSFSDGRQAMANCLAHMGEDAEPTIPALLPLLADRDDRVRAAVASALENIGVKTIPALIELIQSRDAQRLKVEMETLATISQWCNRVYLGIPVLDTRKAYNNLCWAAYDLLQNQENLESAQWAALHLLGKFGPSASSAIPSIIQALSDSNPRIQLAAAKALCNIDRNWITSPPANKAITSLSHQLGKNKESSETAVIIFTQIGAGAVPIIN